MWTGGKRRIFLTDYVLVLLCVRAKGNLFPESIPQTPLYSLRRTGARMGGTYPGLFLQKKVSLRPIRLVYHLVLQCTYVH